MGVSASVSGKLVETLMSFEVSVFPSVTAFAPTVTLTVPAVSGGRIVASQTEFRPFSDTRLAPVESVMSSSVSPVTWSVKTSSIRKSFLSSGSLLPIVLVSWLPRGTGIISNATDIIVRRGEVTSPISCNSWALVGGNSDSRLLRFNLIQTIPETSPSPSF